MPRRDANRLRNFGPCLMKPRMKTLKKVSTASVAVTASCEVTVKVQLWPARLPTAKHHAHQVEHQDHA